MQCDVINCAECSFIAYNCSKCSDGYFLKSNVCLAKCPDDSKTCGVYEICVNGSTCEKCPRDMLNIDKQCMCEDKTVCGERQYCYEKTCVPCTYHMPNCLDCTKSNKCTQCRDGYDNVDGACRYKCGTSTCIESSICVNESCEYCPTSQVNNDGQCKCRGLTPDCPKGTYCTYSGCTACSSSMANCFACISNYQCTEVLNPCDDFNCQMCESTTAECKKCNEGYNLTFDWCSYKCGISQMCSNSEICVDDYKCEKCLYGMRSYANVCACGDEVCVDGQYCVVTERKCKQCNVNMPNCKKCVDLNTCSQPLSPCTVANCAMCEQTVGKCSKCNTGYILTDNVCMQTCGNVECHEKEICVDGTCKLCAVNEINLAGTCSCALKPHCEKGTYCSLEGKCEACQAHCKTCNGATCYVCEPNYAIASGVCKKSNKTAIIAGSVTGGVVIVLLIVGMLYYFLKYRRQREYTLKKSAQPTTSQVADLQQDQMYI